MKILSFKEKSNKDCVVCLGRFDGLHKGHRKLVSEGASIAENEGLSLCLFTIRPTGASENILLFDELCDRCERLGVETLIFGNDSPEFFDTSADDFLSVLKDGFSAKYFVCGEDFTYGAGRKGNVATLFNFCRENSVDCRVVDILTVDGEKVSSSKIKEMLSEGKVFEAAKLLGEEFCVSGEVVEGRKVGRKLGFSTANVVYPDKKAKIARGVYATKTVVDGVTYNSVSNFGSAPTFGAYSELLETHVIGFGGDLYGKNITVKFVDFMRENKKFADENELIEQLKKDIKYYD